jgi:Haemolymph juvenile hormone binding protein (JHBP)
MRKSILSFCLVPASYIKPCRRDDPKLNECVKSIIEGLRSQMAEGIPELLVPPCEPLIVPQLNISQQHGAVHAMCECTNIEVKGPSNFQLQSVRVYLDKDEFRLIIRFPELHMKSNYKLQGKILMLPLHGAGVMTGKYSELIHCYVLGQTFNFLKYLCELEMFSF